MSKLAECGRNFFYLVLFIFFRCNKYQPIQYTGYYSRGKNFNNIFCRCFNKGEVPLAIFVYKCSDSQELNDYGRSKSQWGRMMRQISQMVVFCRDAYSGTFPNIVLCNLKCFFEIANGILQTLTVKAPCTGVFLNKIVDLLMGECNVAICNDGFPNKQRINRSCHDPTEYCECVVKLVCTVCISFKFRAYSVQSIIKGINVYGVLWACRFCNHLSSNNFLFLRLVFCTILFLNSVCAVKDSLKLFRICPPMAFIGTSRQSGVTFILCQHLLHEFVRL